MDFDPNDPPLSPPPECTSRLVWMLARALWEAHGPNADGFCSVTGCQRANRLHPCPSVDLALDGMRAACGRPTRSAAFWRALARRLVAANAGGPANSGWRHFR